MSINPHIAEMADLRLYEAETSVELVAARFGIDPARIVDFSLNVNPFGPPSAAVAAAQTVLAGGNLYPDLKLATLRRALAARHDVPEGALFFGAGLDDVLKLLIQAWAADGDKVLVHLPTFPRYELEARLRGCRPVTVEAAEPWRIDAAALDAALRREAPALAFLCTPNNPTGATLEDGAVEALVAGHPGTLFLVDEALIDPSTPGVIGLVARYGNVAVLRTFSKYFGLAGYRVGYAVAPPRLVEMAEIGRPPFNVAQASAAAALAALDDTAFLARCRETFAREAAYFTEAVERIGGCRVRGRYSNMLLLQLERMTSPACVEALAARGLLVADGKSFRGLERVETIRVSLQDRPQNERLVAAMEAIL